MKVFSERRNLMVLAALFNGSMYMCMVGVLAATWGLLQRGDS
jgi:hypothetical protein